MPLIPGGGGATTTILCAIQDAELRDELRGALAHCRATVVPTAFEALRAAGQGAFDAYLLSYWLPDLAGTSLCREIRKLDPHAPVCIVAAGPLRAERSRALRAGADAVLDAKEARSVVAETLRPLLRHAEERNERARVDADRAIHEERNRQAGFLAEHPGEALSAEASERLLRAKALQAFVAAGGSLADFDRKWPATYAGIARGIRRLG